MKNMLLLQGDVIRLFHTERQAFLTVDRLVTEASKPWVVFSRLTARADAAEATSSHALFEVQVVEFKTTCKLNHALEGLFDNRKNL